MDRSMKSTAVKYMAGAAVLALLGTTLAGCGPAKTAKGAAAPARGAGNIRQMAVETQEVKMSDVGGGQVFTGAVSTPFITNVSSRISGRVIQLSVKAGDRVKVGQTLAKIDTTALQQQLAQSQSSAAVSEAQASKSQTDLANSVAAQQKALELQQVTFDKTKSDQDNAVSSAKQALFVAQAQLKKAQTDQLNTVNERRQSVAVAQAQLDKAIFDSQTAISSAKNAVAEKTDGLALTAAQQQTAYTNSVSQKQLAVSQALKAYDDANQAYQNAFAADPADPGLPALNDKKDQANNKLQQANLDLSSVQSPSSTNNTVISAAQSALNTAVSNLSAAQNSLSVSVSQQQLAQAQTQFNTAISQSIEINQQQLAQSQLSVDNAMKTQETTLSVAQAQLAQSQQAYANAQSADSLKISQAQLQQAQTNIRVLSEQLKDGVLSSPVEGIVTAINVPVGQNAGAQAGIVSIAAADPVQATVNVSENNIGKIKAGDPMTVQVTTLGKSYEGTVLAVRPTMDATTKTYGVDIKLSDPNQELLPGMFASSSLKSEGRKAIMIPAEAVMSQPSGNAVFIVVDGKAKKVSVKVGTITSAQFEIMEGLQAGDQLVVKGQELLSDNVPVSIGGQPADPGAAKGQGGAGGNSQIRGQGGTGGQGGANRQPRQNGAQPSASPSASPEAKAGGTP